MLCTILVDFLNWGWDVTEPWHDKKKCKCIQQRSTVSTPPVCISQTQSSIGVADVSTALRVQHALFIYAWTAKRDCKRRNILRVAASSKVQETSQYTAGVKSCIKGSIHCLQCTKKRLCNVISGSWRSFHSAEKWPRWCQESKERHYWPRLNKMILKLDEMHSSKQAFRG